MTTITESMWNPSMPGWTSPSEQLDRLVSPPSYYEESLKKRFPDTIATLIAAYAHGNLGKNAYQWYLAVRKLNIVPQKVPPVPFNIHDMLESTCPIEGEPRRITDTHSLWLIPGGLGLITNIDELAKICGQGCDTDFLGPKHPGLREGRLQGLRTDKTVGFLEPEWIVIYNCLLFGSKSTCDDECKISKLRDKSFVNYELPSFKYALAANLLKLRLDGNGLWEKNGKVRRLTRVQEDFSFIRNRIGLVRDYYNLTVGHRRVKGQVATDLSCISSLEPEPETNSSDWDIDVGVAPIWVGFSAKPPSPNSTCTLS